MTDMYTTDEIRRFIQGVQGDDSPAKKHIHYLITTIKATDFQFKRRNRLFHRFYILSVV